MPYVYSLEIKSKRQKVSELPPALVNSVVAARYAKKSLYGSGILPAQEEIHLIFLDKKAKVISSKRLSIGGLDASFLDIRLCLMFALGVNAFSVILVHNHPSGDCKPSQHDIQMTEKLKKGLSAIGIQLFDHLILSDEGYFSFAEDIKKKY